MERKIEVLKALSDINRLLILEMLSCGEMCACDIMEKLELTQPTISHHMKILQKAGLVRGRKKGKWVIYTINKGEINELCSFIQNLTSDKENCICKKVTKRCNAKE